MIVDSVLLSRHSHRTVLSSFCSNKLDCVPNTVLYLSSSCSNTLDLFPVISCCYRVSFVQFPSEETRPYPCYMRFLPYLIYLVYIQTNRTVICLTDLSTVLPSSSCFSKKPNQTLFLLVTFLPYRIRLLSFKQTRLCSCYQTLLPCQSSFSSKELDYVLLSKQSWIVFYQSVIYPD